MTQYSAGAAFRKAVQEESPLQVVGAINANHALLAKRAGYKAIYLSGGGVAAGSLGLPDLGISSLDDVLTDIRRITDVCDLPLLVDADTGFGSSAFNVARTVKSMIKFGAAALHIEDQVGAKRCGHRPGKEIVSKEEMVDRIKAAVDARTDPNFVIMARTDALAVDGMEAALERAVACVEAGADMIFPEAITDLDMYATFAKAVNVPILANITEFGSTPLFTLDELRSAHVGAAQFIQGEQRRGTEFSDVGQNRHVDGFGEGGVHVQVRDRFREDHVGARFNAGHGAFQCRFHAIDGQRIGARHDDEVRVGARIDGRLDAVDHFFLAHDFLARTVAATLGAHLVFDVQGGRAELDHRFHGARHVEGGRTETRVGVDQQRQVAHVGDAADVGQHVVQAGNAQVGQAQRAGRDAAAGQVDGLVTGALGQQGVVGVDGADHLQRGFFLDGLAECGTCGVLSHVFTLWVSDGPECFTEWL